MANNSPNIAIVGGGISGLVLAIALLRRGIKVQVYEQAHAFGEIGAGVAFGPNSVRAMQTCSPDIHAAFHKVATRNQWPDKRNVWFDFMDGYDKDAPLVKLVPDGVAHFKKHLDTIELPTGDGKVKLLFHDGTEAEADAVIGCDGIKSRTRAWMLGGDDKPGAAPVYTYKYAYRGLIPMQRAVDELGEDNAKNAKMHLGQDGHILTFPVNHGETMNVVAFHATEDDWPDARHLTRSTEKKHVYEDFKDFGPTVQKIIDLLEPNLDCWAIFDTGDHPMEAYNKSRVCCLGDAAHATSPHHGAGAGICIEDAAVMAELLAMPGVAQAGIRGLEAAFRVFSECRRERTQWLVQSSRRTGDLYEWRAEGVGRDVGKIYEECKERDERIWDSQIEELVVEAKESLAAILGA
ncbi:hypothetical protein B0A54_15791 [Friedmanniomyces endolithicus]|uniref:FAD-binding domain-containing protein n=1 Tax=Friedmanniomyces endolithicus TaxID=329885 RepID=A0A4U0U6P1_9PEZI|nr:hypothetical protein LTS09_017249 [Friedmanniomyces endolithicus]TKA30870.1 hypothetical protein B0A54_15791 [Friedmanniomyces endolithicus]